MIVPPISTPCVSGSPTCFSSFPPSPPVSILQGFSTNTSNSAEINVSGLTFANGLVNNFAFISNQYDPNTALSGGTINLGTISLNSSGTRSLVVDSRGGININGGISPLTPGLDVGEILLLSDTEITVGDLVENVGDISITANKLTALNGNQIRASTDNSNDAGNIFVKTNEIEFIGTDATGVFSGLSSITNTGSSGNAGTITVETSLLTLKNGAQIRTSTFGSGDAGAINVKATEAIAIDGRVVIGANSASSGIVSEIGSTSSGSGSLTNVETSQLTLTNGGILSTSTAGSGNAGNIKVNVSNDITVTGEGSGIFASTTATSTGDGGSVDIDPIFIRLSDGGSFSVNSEGTGAAGNLRVVGDILILDNGLIDASSQAGSGGNLGFDINNYILLQNGSNISTNAGLTSGSGDGGNITINVPFILALLDQDSNITANAFAGSGGSITISANALLGIAFNDENVPVINDITVSSKSGIDGEFIFNSPELDPSSGIAKLITDLGDNNDKVVSACATGQDLNSFTVTGQGGIIRDPSSLVRGSNLLSDMRDFSGGQVSTEVIETAIATNQTNNSLRTLPQATHFKMGDNGLELAAAPGSSRRPKVASNCL